MSSAIQDWTARVLQLCGVSSHMCPLVRGALSASDTRIVDLLAAVGQGAGLTQDEAELRCAALLLQNASIQLADDLADGEATGLPQPHKLGPALQSVMLVAAFELLLRSRVSRHVLQALCVDLLSVGAAHVAESLHDEWNHAHAVLAAEGLNGAQYRAVFRIVLDGTEYESVAAQAGWHFGCVLHVAGDRLSRDERWTRLAAPDQQTLLTWASSHLEQVRALQLPGLFDQLDWFGGVLATPLPEPAQEVLR